MKRAMRYIHTYIYTHQGNKYLYYICTRTNGNKVQYKCVCVCVYIYIYTHTFLYNIEEYMHIVIHI